MLPKILRLAAASLLVVLFVACPVLVQLRDTTGYTVTVVIPAGPNVEFDLRNAMLSAIPGTIIELPAGHFQMIDQLTLDVPHVMIRGQGMALTILDFSTQETSGDAFLLRGDDVTVQDFTILDPPGDGIRFDGVNGIIAQRVRVEWSTGADPTNGAYGLYPVSSRNVLIDGCVIVGASDAGIYVGQSELIIVRRNQVRLNVAGIEIENSKDADVYWNVATGNTGGILVFDLPGLPVQGGRRTRVFENQIVANNEPNFGPPGSTLSLVPAGTGMIVMANDDVEVFDNDITDHKTVSISLTGYQITNFGMGPYVPPPGYDPYVEAIEIHDNRFTNTGYDPQETLGQLGTILLGTPTLPAILYSGFIDPAKVDPATGELPPHLKICIENNVGGSFGTFSGLVALANTDVTPHLCDLPAVVAMPLEPAGAISPAPPGHTPAGITALCNAPGVGVNWAALDVNCPKFSDYRLFQDPLDTTRNPTAPGLFFDISTPLFSDYAQKVRFVYLPPGQPASYDPSAPFDFPVGTVIAKTFSFAHDLRDLSLGEELVESRLLIRRAGGWIGLVYLWRADDSAADLALGGGVETVQWIDVAGNPQTTDYRVPHQGQCTTCHQSPIGAAPLGPKVGLLNYTADFGAGIENQIDRWENAGILAGVPLAGADPGWPAWDDPAADVTERARAYLDIGCAHCHNPAGRAGATNFHLQNDPANTNLGICKTVTAAGPGGGNLLYDIVPGDPAASIAIFRMDSTALNVRMPELSRSVIHTEGVALVSQWIAQMPGPVCN